jgi:hypothetical protein
MITVLIGLGLGAVIAAIVGFFMWLEGRPRT